MTCLDIPLPSCLQELLRAPPVALGNTADHEVLELIKSFGRELGRSEVEVMHACNLASGPADVVGILERPHSNQNYSLNFEQLVSDCKTLRAVDDLIRFATKGTRSIHTVTVLDAFSFKSSKAESHPSDEACHEILKQILQVKKPRVVLCCWSGDCISNPHNYHHCDCSDKIMIL